jgi:hypothetical protein
MKNFLYYFVEGQIHFGMPRGAIMSLAPNEPIENVLHSNLHTDCKHTLKTYQTWKVLETFELLFLSNFSIHLF